MLIAALSYSTFESISCNTKNRQKNLTKVEKYFLFCKCWGH